VRQIRLSPEQGWISVTLLLLMAMLLGWTIDDSRWILGRDGLTDFLTWAALGGAIVGVTGGVLGLGRWRTYLIGSVLAALIVPTLIGSIILNGPASLVEMYQATARSTVEAVHDLVVLGRGSTQQFGHFQLTLGIFLWATCMFAGYAAFGHRRPVPALLALGIPFLVSITLTRHDQLVYLVLGSLLGLLLLVRLHAFDERMDWMRRRIGDPGPIQALTDRGGTAFAAVAVAGALLLTSVAQSKPLESFWTGAEPWLIDVGSTLQRYFGFLSSPRGPASVDFGPDAEIGTTWISDRTEALVIRVPPGDDTPYYWRASAYDVFTGSGWAQSDESVVRREAGQGLLADTLETPAADGRRTVGFTVVPTESYRARQLLSPSDPVTVDQDISLRLVGDGGWFASATLDAGPVSYTATALVRTTGDDEAAAITENKLRAAGTDYPAAVLRYTEQPIGVVGPNSLIFLTETKASLDRDTPYDLALALERRLKDPDEFRYRTDVSSVDCKGSSVVECFIDVRQGFCTWYASTMAGLLRHDGIPARLVQGFLPGELVSSGSRVIRFSDAHAWVEVYFPGYGWVPFDPTGSVAQLEPLPRGEPIPIPSPTPRPSRGGDDDGEFQRPSESPIPGGATPGGSSGSPLGPGPFILIAIVLTVVVGWAAFVAYRRGPREISADDAWGTVTRLARRLGFGPRPTQTVYEYATALGEVLPSMEPELQTVALAKVEVAYGRHVLGSDRLAALRAATGRLRVGLLRLVLRRGRRPRRR
jgi:transglutaminase-like putative cysteine protease